MKGWNKDFIGKVVTAVFKLAGALLQIILKVSFPYHPNKLTRPLLERVVRLGARIPQISVLTFSTLSLRLSTHLSP